FFIGTWEALQRQHAELRASNEELAAREEEITRQNEELQSQTEELERQSEELRVTNEEMAAREKMLEILLDLSRSLHVKLSDEETMTRICETLGQLINGPHAATAILLKTPTGVKIRCQYGFGPAGVEKEEIPIERTFAALVLEQ